MFIVLVFPTAGLSTPEVVSVQTPATKERPRVLKRKTFFDLAPIIPIKYVIVTFVFHFLEFELIAILLSLSFGSCCTSFNHKMDQEECYSI